MYIIYDTYVCVCANIYIYKSINGGWYRPIPPTLHESLTLLLYVL